MDQAEIRQTAREVLALVLGVELNELENREVSRSTLAAWDSLKHIDVVFSLEERFGVMFAEEEMPELNSLDNICSIVESRINGSS